MRYFYLMIDKWGKEYYVKTVFCLRDNKQATDFMQENGKISLANHISWVWVISPVRYLFGRLKSRGGRAVCCVGAC